MAKTVIGIFADRTDAESAINELEDEGFKTKDLSIIMRDAEGAREIGETTGSNVAGSTVAGATTGAVIGGLAGLLAAIAIPGLGAFLVGGPLAAALGLTGAAASTVSGAATGAVAGGLLGALMGLGLPREEAERYETQIREGGILLAVPTVSGQMEVARDILEENGATDITSVAMPRNADEYSDFEDEGVDEYQTPSYHDEPMYHHSVMGAKGGRTRVRSHTRRRRRTE